MTTTYYFEIKTKQTGWLRIEANSEQEAMDAVKVNGFDASGIIETNMKTIVTSIEGGEEKD